MNKTTIHLAGVALLAAAAMSAGAASATIYDFSAALDQGPNTGTLTGTVDLQFVTGNGSGTGAATTVTITGLPAGLTIQDGNIATDWASQVANTFTVTNGLVTFFQFNAVVANPDGSDLCLNAGGDFGGGGRGCPHNLIFIGDGGASNFGFNFGGANGITFTAEAGAGGNGGVPEPASWALMIAGFGLAGAALRRRTAQAAA